MKLLYNAPLLEFIETDIEKGIAFSGTHEGFGVAPRMSPEFMLEEDLYSNN